MSTLMVAMCLLATSWVVVGDQQVRKLKTHIIRVISTTIRLLSSKSDQTANTSRRLVSHMACYQLMVVTCGNVVCGRRRPAGQKAEDPRLGRRGDVRPGRSVTQSGNVGQNVQRSCCRRVWHDVYCRPPVSTLQLRRN